MIGERGWEEKRAVADPGGDAGMHPPHQLDTIIYAGIYWRTGATVVVSV
jgi:hypothetical protein